MKYEHVTVPAAGRRIEINGDFSLTVPDRPIIPFIEGDGIGIDVTPAMQRVVDAAVAKAYGERRRICWMEVYSGEKANLRYGQWFPEETLHALREFVVSIKGPLGDAGRWRHALTERRHAAEPGPVRLRASDPLLPGGREPDARREPDRHGGVPREHRGHLRGHRVAGGLGGGPSAHRLPAEPAARHRDPLPFSSGIGIKPVSKEGSQRLIRKAIQYAIEHDRVSVTLVHKGNIMKFTEGAFRNWGYQLAREEFGARPIGGGPVAVLQEPAHGHRHRREGRHRG